MNTPGIERPDGIKIASWFIIAIVLASFGSRLKRSTELRFKAFEFADLNSKFLWDSLKFLEFPVLVPHRPGRRFLGPRRLVPPLPLLTSVSLWLEFPLEIPAVVQFRNCQECAG